MQLFLNPTEQDRANLEGLDYISTLIHRYAVLERIYCQRDKLSDANSPQDVGRLRVDFETDATELYTRILEYQARSACRFSRHKITNVARDIIKADNWDGLLEQIKAS